MPVLRLCIFIGVLIAFTACDPSKQVKVEDYSKVTFSQALDSARAYFGLGDSTLHPKLKLSAYDSLVLKEAFLKSMTGKNSFPEEKNKVLYGSYDPFTVTITHLLNQKAGMTWGSYSHTGIPVPVYAKGAGQEAFCGYYDNTDIAKKIIRIGELDKPSTTASAPKYIFFFIGDGMAIPQIEATQAYLAHLNPDSSNTWLPNLNILRLPVNGIATSQAQDRYITGSAAAGTALATGYKTTIGTISKSPDHTRNYKTMAEMARDKGKKVGIISSVSIDHATPACFYAHETSRNHYNNIAAQMATSDFEFFGGGFAKGDFEKSKTADPEGDPKDILTIMQQAGYKIATNSSELALIESNEKCWAYTAYDQSGALSYAIDRSGNDLSLADFTTQAIRLLDNPNGFFMMIEGGKIDWACHANDATSAIQDVLAFDEALSVALAFEKQHPNQTLIVVTGDHECGALSLGYATTKYNTAFEILDYQKMSFQAFNAQVESWKTQSTQTLTKY